MLRLPCKIATRKFQENRKKPISIFFILFYCKNYAIERKFFSNGEFKITLKSYYLLFTSLTVNEQYCVSDKYYSLIFLIKKILRFLIYFCMKKIQFEKFYAFGPSQWDRG